MKGIELKEQYDALLKLISLYGSEIDKQESKQNKY